MVDYCHNIENNTVFYSCELLYTIQKNQYATHASKNSCKQPVPTEVSAALFVVFDKISKYAEALAFINIVISSLVVGQF